MVMIVTKLMTLRSVLCLKTTTSFQRLDFSPPSRGTGKVRTYSREYLEISFLLMGLLR